MVERISISGSGYVIGILKVIEEVKKAHELFNAEFENLKSILNTLDPRVDSVRDFDEKAAHHLSTIKPVAEARGKEMAELLQRLKECDLLVRKCVKVPMWNIFLIRVYTERLKDQKESLKKFVATNMMIDVWEILRTTRTADCSIFSRSAVPEPPLLTVGWLAPVEDLNRSCSEKTFTCSESAVWDGAGRRRKILRAG